MMGFVQEHGPYVIEDGADTFSENPYSWNKETNMFYIESPAGVGYSYCADASECNFNDTTSGHDNLAAILYLFENKFPELLSHDLYIAGESYAGIYVPYVAYNID
jgi:carboxypeptidase C (cathepsin A)